MRTNTHVLELKDTSVIWTAAHIRRIGAFAFCLSLALPHLSNAREISVRDTASPAPRVDARASSLSSRILAAIVEANGVPGMSAAVWRNDAIAWSGYSGYRNVEQKLPVDGQTIFRLASVSKIFAATAAAKLMADGKLDVEAPVSSIVDYLPQWPPFTSVELAAHTSGMPHYQPVDEGRGKIKFATVREAVDLLRGRELLFAPSERFSYSSWGYTLLTAAVEESSNRSYLQYLSEEITSNLTIVPDATAEGNPNASIAYEFSDGVVRAAAPHDYSYSWGGAGLGATAPDLVRFGGRLMAGKIVSAPTLNWMLTPAKLRDGSQVVDRGSTVGFGWRSGRDLDGDRTAHHAGVTVGARSALVLYPDLGIGVSVLSNASWVSSIEQTAMMLAAPFKPIVASEPVVCPTQAVAYKGEYEGKTLAGTAHVVVEDGACTATLSVSNAFGDWLNSFMQKDAETIKLIGLDLDGGFSRAALVTPAGVYDLRAQPAGRHLASLSEKSAISIQFLTPD